MYVYVYVYVHVSQCLVDNTLVVPKKASFGLDIGMLLSLSIILLFAYQVHMFSYPVSPTAYTAG